MNRPDFSPAMLRAFLRIRVDFAVRTGMRDGFDMVKAEKAALKRAAGVTTNEFHFAWMGWLQQAGPRVRLWAALGIFPADQGWVLTDDGGQEKITDTRGAAA